MRANDAYHFHASGAVADRLDGDELSCSYRNDGCCRCEDEANGYTARRAQLPRSSRRRATKTLMFAVCTGVKRSSDPDAA